MDPLVSQAVVEVCTRTGDVKLAEPRATILQLNFLEKLEFSDMHHHRIIELDRS